MRYTEFKNRFMRSPLILSRDISMLEKDTQVIRNQLKRWQDKGLIVKLKKGFYLLNENDRKINPSKQFIANQLYAPSYVSLEYALNFYGLIPERVADATSVTTKKTARFANKAGSFVYQHIKPSAFRGFKAVKDEYALTFFIAVPEKAAVDFFYLNLDKIRSYDRDMFENSYRFQNVEKLKQKLIMDFAGLFRSNKLTKVSRLFCEFIKEEKRR